MPGTRFGTLFSPSQLEAAVIATLQAPPPGGTDPRLVYYLAALERANGLTPRTFKTPPGPSSYRGGADAGTLNAEWFPMLHVVVAPAGQPQRLDRYEYAQAYQVQVTSTCGDDDENTARLLANAYGTCVAKLIADHGSLGIGAVDTEISRLPGPELLDPVNARQVCRTTVTFATTIAPVLTVGGPTVWPASAYTDPGSWPEVLTTAVTVVARPID